MSLTRIVSVVVAVSCMVVLTAVRAGAQPVAGEDYIWIDLGEENEGLLLTQAGGITVPAVKAGVDCRENPWPYDGPGGNHIYFRIDDRFLRGGDTEVWIVVEYSDSAESLQVDIQYDSNDEGPVQGSFRGADDGAFEVVIPEGTDTWRTHAFHILDGRFDNCGNRSDLRISSHGDGPIWINRVRLGLIEAPDPLSPDAPFEVTSTAVSPGGRMSLIWAAVKAVF